MLSPYPVEIARAFSGVGVSRMAEQDQPAGAGRRGGRR